MNHVPCVLLLDGDIYVVQEVLKMLDETDFSISSSSEMRIDNDFTFMKAP